MKRCFLAEKAVFLDQIANDCNILQPHPQLCKLQKVPPMDPANHLPHILGTEHCPAIIAVEETIAFSSSDLQWFNFYLIVFSWVFPWKNVCFPWFFPWRHLHRRRPKCSPPSAAARRPSPASRTRARRRWSSTRMRGRRWREFSEGKRPSGRKGGDIDGIWCATQGPS